MDVLERKLGDVLRRPGDDGYVTATQPRNLTAQQRPVAVVAATGAEDVARAVKVAAEAGLAVVAQATGHGAAGTVTDDVLMVDTSRLDSVVISPASRTCRVGYTIFGGIGWLTRRHGMASAALRRVEFVDGNGDTHVADAEQNRDAWWAYRGAGGVGIATAVEIDLVPIDDLWAGYQLWPAAHAERIVAAWVSALENVDDALTSAFGILLAPDAPTVPENLRGQRVVHLSAASTRGSAGFAPLYDALRSAPQPAIDTVGPCDAQRLGRIHLDPPAPVPAVGDGPWLTAGTPAHAYPILAAHGLGNHAPLSEIEIRHVATTAGADSAGALTRVPGPFLLHAVGPAPTTDDRRNVQRALATVRSAAAPADTGHGSTSFRDGQTTAADALTSEDRTRLGTIRHRFDPHPRVRQPRTL